jgi:hypothetical protein
MELVNHITFRCQSYVSICGGSLGSALQLCKQMRKLRVLLSLLITFLEQKYCQQVHKITLHFKSPEKGIPHISSIQSLAFHFMIQI